LWACLEATAQAQDPDPAAEAGCIDLAQAVKEIHQHLEEVLLEEAHLLALKTQRALSCQVEPVPALLLTALFGASGALELFEGDEAAARRDFQHALSFSATSALDARYGDEALALYSQVQAEALALQGAKVTLHGNVEAWLDGNSVVLGQPLDLRPGQHLLQWREIGAPLTTHILQVLPGDVRTGWLTGKPVDKRPVRAASGLSLALAGGSLVALGAQQVTKFENYPEEFRIYGDESPNKAGLERLARRNHVLVVSGGLLSLAGLGVAGLALAPPETDNLGLSIGGTW
jgi:hypothetical protein